MLETLIGIVGKAAGSLVLPAWKWYETKFRRPQIKLRKCPQNLLDFLRPAASPERVKELLGPPHQVVGDYWAYRFADVLVQVEFWQGSGAKSIAIGLVGNRKAAQFPIPVCSKPLGRLSIEDVREGDDTLRYRSSLRHEDVLVEARIGTAGAWTYWTFGATTAFGARALHESYFEWDRDADRLKSPPSLVLVNWVALSNSADEVYFDWSFG